MVKEEKKETFVTMKNGEKKSLTEMLDFGGKVIQLLEQAREESDSLLEEVNKLKKILKKANIPFEEL